jgi:hypothetical protein
MLRATALTATDFKTEEMQALMFGLYENTVEPNKPECVSEALFVIRSYIAMMTDYRLNDAGEEIGERVNFKWTVELHGNTSVVNNVEDLEADIRPAVNMILDRYVTEKLSKLDGVTTPLIAQFRRQRR